jgi:L-aminopeptidase/D-esterase-like protein
MKLVSRVHAVLLAGGSAFGLDAAGGVVRYLEEKGTGYDTRVAKVPIVPAAILFDLGIGQASVRPDAAMGYQACQNASREAPAEGNVGAGTGASVGKIFGMAGAMKAGIGSASVLLGEGIVVAAIAAVNAFGDVIDPNSGQILAGARTVKAGPFQVGSSQPFANTLETMKSLAGKAILSFAMKENTVIGAVATNAGLSKEEANIIAQMAHDGLARTIRPAHTMFDGDTIFALSTGRRRVDVNTIGAYAAEAFGEAVLHAVRAARPAGGLPAINSL